LTYKKKYDLIFYLFLFALSLILFLENGHSYWHLWRIFSSQRWSHKPKRIILLTYSLLLEKFKLLFCDELHLFSHCQVTATFLWIIPRSKGLSVIANTELLHILTLWLHWYSTVNFFLYILNKKGGYVLKCIIEPML
jgi:hypothetical protein